MSEKTLNKVYSWAGLVFGMIHCVDGYIRVINHANGAAFQFILATTFLIMSFYLYWVSR